MKIYNQLNAVINVMYECFNPVREPLTQREIVEDVILCRRSELNRLNFKGFYVVLLENDDELISAATVRCHAFPELSCYQFEVVFFLQIEVLWMVQVCFQDMEMMKERFSKLLLGEDMSGSGKGVCTVLAISNAIANLCATAFGQLWRLEPLPSEKKHMWQREMECLLCVSDHIVEFKPSWQTLADGSKLEIMRCRQRSDIFVNLPALRKLDNVLLGLLDNFTNTEFWYVDKGITTPEPDGLASFHKPLRRQEDKWWLPMPRVPTGGLQEDTRKKLNHKRESANQILKAAMAINSVSLSEMEVPESYLECLPKDGKVCLGDVIYQYIISEQFSSEFLLDCLDLSSQTCCFRNCKPTGMAINLLYFFSQQLCSKMVPNI